MRKLGLAVVAAVIATPTDVSVRLGLLPVRDGFESPLMRRSDSRCTVDNGAITFSNFAVTTIGNVTLGNFTPFVNQPTRNSG